MSENIILSMEEFVEAQKYWIEKFGDDIRETRLPLDFNIKGEYIEEQCKICLGERLSQEVLSVAKGNDLTLYVILLAAMKVLLYKYTRSDSVVIGSPVYSPVDNKFNRLVALKDNIRDEMSFREVVSTVSKTVSDGYKNQHYPYDKLLESLNVDKELSLLRTILMIEKIHKKEDADLAAKAYGNDIIISFAESNNELLANVTYNEKLFKKDTINNLIKKFGFVLEQVLENREIKVSDVLIITEEERNKILFDFNSSKVIYPDGLTIHKIFEDQAQKTPENIALVDKERKLSYMELNKKVNQLARILRKNGVRQNVVVGIMFDRSAEMIVSILGVLKAGGAYLPIDQNYPKKRIEFVTTDSNAKLILTQSSLNGLVPEEADVMILDDVDSLSGDDTNPSYESSAEDLAYIIYTSGSTGNPKGVMVKHAGICNLKGYFIESYKMTGKDKVVQFASCSFDASVWEYSMALFTGSTLVIVDKDTIGSFEDFERFLNTNEVTVATLPPPYLANMDQQKLPLLRLLVTAGSATNFDLFKKWSSKLTYVNAYGPTETSIAATSWIHNGENIDYCSIPIGRPIPNMKVYILDKNMKLLPVGIPGELCVSGFSLAKGYLNNEQLTNEKFVESPYNVDGEIKTSMIYKTGDLARWLPDGNIEYLGRIDEQVKIRGFRIEIGEIENSLINHDEITDATVIVKEDKLGNSYLCAYVVGDSDLNASRIKDYLRESLPEYMIPSYIVLVSAMPLTIAGKVDKKALPEPFEEMEYIAPENEIQMRLEKLFGEVLGMPKVSINGDFFELGGHSLKVGMLVSKIHKEFEVQVPIGKVFRYPTIKELSTIISESDESIYNSIQLIPEQEYYKLSSAQKRLFILNQMNDSGTGYNMPGITILEGSLDKERFSEAFNSVIKRHESFRTSFDICEGQPVQRIHREVEFSVEFEVCRMEDVNIYVKDFVKPFNLKKAPLLRVKLLQVGDEKYIFMFDMHHIIADGVSMGILVKEFQSLYQDEALEPLKIQYKDYAHWQNDLVESDAIKEQEKYWIDVFKDDVPLLNIHTDYPRPLYQSFEGHKLSFKVDAETTRKLRALAVKTGTTTYMMLLAAYNVLLYRYTGQDDIVVGSPVAGRPHADLENIVGVFINTIAMRNYPNGDMTFEEFLNNIKENTLKAFENQDYQFEELVEKLNIKRDLGRNPLFDTMLVLQNADAGSGDIEGLSFSPYEYDSVASKFDITVNARESDDTIDFDIEYAVKLFNQNTIEKMAGSFIRILKAVVQEQKIQISKIMLNSDEERKKLLEEFNNTEKVNPYKDTIVGMFLDQVAKKPDEIAVVANNESITYRELNERADGLSNILNASGVVKDSIVGIMAERSLDMIVGIMGVLKAGGAYMPISPENAKDRVRYMLKDSGAKILLTQSNLLPLDFEDVKLIAVDNLLEISENESFSNASAEPDSLAYIIYTSGSTGKPKGVMIEHKNVVNLMVGLNESIYDQYHDTLNIALVAPFIFDASVKQIFAALLLGHRLYIVPEDSRFDGESLARFYAENKIHISDGTPVHINLLAAPIAGYRDMLSLRHMIVGGEALYSNNIKEFFKSFGEVKPKITNIYGPTECCVDSTGCDVGIEDLEEFHVLPIGYPMANQRIYILGRDLELVPQGVPGELCIAGSNIGRGYINNEELTKEKFINDPYNPGHKMYRTGDIARWLHDGRIEYIGRNDFQIKIRGHRIETGEIEAELLNHVQISNCIVIALGSENDKVLCAYYVSKEEIVVRELREYLSKAFPDYMIPSYFVHMEDLPLNNNGKIDRSKLPEPDKNINTGMEYVAPTNETEEKLCRIWQDALDCDRVGIHDNFFELGGHSLKAVDIMAKIHKEFDVSIPLREIFSAPVLRDLAKVIAKSGKEKYHAIQPVLEQAYYKTSSAQKRIFILNQMEEDGIIYNIPGVYKIKGQVNIEAINVALKDLVARHESLRTSFMMADGEPVQKIHENVDFSINVKKDNQYTVEELAKAFIKPFNLGKAPLFRAELVQIEDNEYIFMMDMHHIISDGVSMSILVKEFGELYSGKTLQELPIQYKDFSNWQNEFLKSEAMKKQEEYWLGTFKNDIPVLNLCTDYKRPAVQSSEGDTEYLNVGGDLLPRLREFCKNTGTTLYMVLLAAYNTLLSKYTGQDDIIVGSPIAGRHHADLKGVIGMFVNTLALRNRPEGDMTFGEFLSSVKENTLKAFENQDYQFEELVENLNITRDMSRNPLFDTMFAVATIEDDRGEIQGLDISSVGFESKISKFDLMLYAIENENELQIQVEYCTKLFKQDSIKHFMEHYINILEKVLTNPEQKLCEIDILSKDEKQLVLEKFNDVKSEYPKNSSIAELFEEQVARVPQKIAITYKGKAMTYRELNQKANQLARLLRFKGVNSESIVGIMTDRSCEMLIGILGILKAGGAYLPVDPEYPDDRKSFLLQDGKVKIVLTQKHLLNQVEVDVEEINLEDECIYQGEDTDLDLKNSAEDLAYIIYTSGSTGKPKGVMVEHRNVVRLVKNTNYIQFNDDDRILQTGAIVFDATTFEFWGALLNGLSLYIVDEDCIVDGARLEKSLKDNKITTLWLTSPLFNQLSQQRPDMFEGLRNLLVGGDVLSCHHINEVRKRCKNLTVINGYGPTENTTFSVCHRIDRDYEENIPIGMPISNSTAYIVDKQGNPLPIGVPGELWVGGDGVARGYLNRPELTEERFIDNPFVSGEKIYRTGDLARWLADGRIEFLGRIDQQVKIRGFRIELGEIETVLLNHQGIRESVVIAKGQGSERYLCAYYVSDEEISVGDLRAYIGKTLPDYMIPSYFVHMEKLPLNQNGKIDKNKLPEPDGNINTGIEYVAPTNETEEKLCDLWKDILAVQTVGIYDNFFELGGHSLKATNLMARIHKEFHVSLPLRDVFTSPVLKDLAKLIDKSNKEKYQAIMPVKKQEYYKVSSAQKRLFVLNQLSGNDTSYNISGVYKIKGKVNIDAINIALKNLILRHESLRTSFIMVEGDPVQKICDEVEFSLNVKKDSQSTDEELAKAFIRPFNLGEAPLFRAELVEREDEYIFMMDMHHIISDGVSMGILIKEFGELYSGKTLQELPIQYKDFSNWQNEFLKSEAMKKQEEYWLGTFKNDIPVLNLCTDYKRPAVQSFEGDTEYLNVGGDLLPRLREFCKDTGITLYMVLLAAYNTLLSKYTGQDDIIVGSPIAGRHHADLEGIIGMFVNTLALRNRPEGDMTFGEFLSSVKENTLKAFENQDYQFEELVEKLNITRDMSRNPLFDTMFAVATIEDGRGEIQGLDISSVGFESKISKFDLMLYAIENENELQIQVEYCTKLFKRDSIIHFMEHYINFLEKVLTNPEQKLCEIDILSKDEKQLVLEKFNDVKSEYPKNSSIAELFEEQVAKVPEKIAITYKGKAMTYRELNQKANQLARLLRFKGVNSESIVGIMTDRSCEMLIGILGILKAGGAYLPVDPEYPNDRKSFLLQDGKVKILLTQKHLLNQVEVDVEEINLEDECIYQGEDTDLDLKNSAEDLAYIIYTSGSTGKPKGVMVEHRNVVRLVKNTNYIQFNDDDRILQTGAIVFDATTFEFWGALLNGLSLYIVDEDCIVDGARLEKSLKDNKITTLWLTSPLFNQLSQQRPNMFEGLRNLLVGGDVLSCHHINEVRKRCKSLTVINGYGPTENTTFSVCHRIDRDYEENIPIGIPISNSTAYIVDKQGNPLPIGVPGELWVGGDGVARGYLNRPELTKERFIDNPFVSGEKIYRTGDLARWLADGTIEFLGRIDQQVKIRGFRIELGEIETVLLNHQGIRESVVIAKGQGSERYLCAYYVSDEEISVGDLRAYIGKTLPDYMIPSYFVHMEKLPLNQNGKIDKNKLPEPDGNINTGIEYVAPKTEIQKNLALVWQSVLGGEKIGINDNFFALGGDSIKAIQISARLGKYGLRFDLKDLFQNPTINTLEALVKSTERVIEQGPVDGKVVLSPIQKWFFEMDSKTPNHFNQAIMLHCKEGFDEEVIKKVFNKIIEHHDALRMIYSVENGIIQYNRGLNSQVFSLEVFDFKNQNNVDIKIEETANRLQSEMDINNGILIKLGLFRTLEGDHLLIAIHHLVIDGISWRILLEDLQTAFECVMKDEEITFPDKTDSFKTWTEKLEIYANGTRFKKEEIYWNKVLATKVKKLPKDKEDSLGTFESSGLLDISFSEIETTKLLKEVNGIFGTEINDVLLSALALTVSKWTNGNDVLVKMEGHGREGIIKGIDISRTVGWFTSMYPVLLKVKENNNLLGTLIEVKETIRKIPNKGIGYGILKYMKENGIVNESIPGCTASNEAESNGQLEISFNYLGQFDQDINKGTFQISEYSTGDSIGGDTPRISQLDIGGQIADGRLVMIFNYNSKAFNKDTIRWVADEYKNNLLMLIDKCLKFGKRQMTPSDYNDNELTIEDLKNITQNASGEIQKIYPLSNMQQGMLFHAMMDKESSAYFEQLAFNIQGSIRIDLYQESFKKLVERHDILRTNFYWDGISASRQVVFKEGKESFSYYDINEIKDVDGETFIERFIDSDKERGFNLSDDPLMRMAVIKIDDNNYKLIWSFHHILIDGWCLGIITKEFFQIYEGLLSNTKPELEKVYPYRDYIEWLMEQDMEEATGYWKEYLNGFDSQTSLPPVARNNGSDEYIHEEYKFSFDESFTHKIEAVASKNSVTVNTIFQSLWGILLGKYNNTTEAVFGAIVSGRPSEVEGIEKIVGLFINTIPVRINIDGDKCFSKMLSDVQEKAWFSQKYDYLPLAQIQAESSLKNALVDHIMAFENFPVEKEVEKTGDDVSFKVSDVKVYEQTNYNFNVVIGVGEEMTIRFTYNGGMYSAEFVKMLESQMRKMFEAVIENPNILIRNIELLSNEEKEKLLNDFNNTGFTYELEKGRPIHNIFEEIVTKHADRKAVVYKDKILTYEALNRLSNSVAYNLRSMGVHKETIVGIMVEPSVEMFIGALAVLKAGGAYLPIDPAYPKDRITYMLKDSGSKLLLMDQAQISDKRWYEQIENGYMKVEDYNNVKLLDLNDEELYECPSENLLSINLPSDMAYVIYTSGSTGKPKGVMVEHQSLVNLCMWHIERYGISEADQSTKYAGWGFDASVWEMFPYLLAGASIHIIEPDLKLDVKNLNKYFNENNITISFLPTQVCEQFMAYENTSLRYLLTGGDKLRYFKKQKYTVVNNYGPTENTVVSTSFDVDRLYTNIPIGKPVYNTKVYVTDIYGNLQPVYSPGELCVAGESLARGYLGRDELTNEKFVEGFSGERIYKTGDLGRWLPDGNLEFMGRIDQQVKIRGYRIELGEIETALKSLDYIEEAVVIDREDATGGKYLCAYLVSLNMPDSKILRDALSKDLPDYMIPIAFVAVDSIPLTPNGKVDRKVLPDPGIYTGRKTIIDTPKDDVEEKLLGIWQEVLGIQEIGRAENFFEIGGHSLKATILVSKIHKVFDVDMPLKEVFVSSSIETQADFIKSAEKKIYSSIEKTQEKDYYELSSAQKRMYILDQFEGVGSSYNIPCALKIEGALDKDRIESSLKALVARHEAFRTSFVVVGDEPMQHIASEIEFKMDYKEDKEENLETIFDDFKKPFDLSKAPLFRALLVKFSDEKHALLYDMHHIISDGTSSGVLAREFAELYLGKSLPPLRIQYKDFSLWQNNLIKTGVIKKQEEYWLDRFSGELPVLNLPTDYTRPPEKCYEGKQYEFMIDKETTEGLRKITIQTGSTMYMVLSAVFNVVISKWSGQNDIIIGSPIAGRHHADLQNVIGMFINMLTMRNYVEYESNFADFLKEVKKTALEAFENQDYQFEEMVERLNIEKDTSRNPIFDVVFTLQNMNLSGEEISELSFDTYDMELNMSKFDICVFAFEVDDQVRCTIEYCTKLFELETIKELGEKFKRAAKAIVENSDVKIKDITIHSEKELEEINQRFAKGKDFAAGLKEMDFDF